MRSRGLAEPRYSRTVSESDSRDDQKELGKLGYAQELLREMGGFSSFAVSFSIISVITGCITTYSDAIGPGGPRAIGLGWPLVSAFTLIVALAMAELSSAFPTAGALYHWSALLGGPGWGWLTALMNLVGQIAVVAAIDLGCARELGAVLGLSGKAALPLLAVVLAAHALLNITRVKLVARLNDFSAIVHLLGVALLVGLLFFFGAGQPLSFLARGDVTNRADGNTSLGFLNGLILSMFTFTGYDASAHLSEETRDPERRAPFGILSAVVVSAIAGYALLVALTLSIRDLDAVTKSDHAALFILETVLGPRGGKMGLALAIIAMWFCGLSSITSASRTLYAFSRDGGLPFSEKLAKVSTRFRTPANAAMVIAIAAFVLTVMTTLASESAFVIVAQVATMGLYVSYALPIALGVVARRRGSWKRRGPFSLGKASTVVASVAVLWTGFVLVVGALPPNLLAGGILLGSLAAMAALWQLFAKKRFTGPRVNLEALERTS